MARRGDPRWIAGSLYFACLAVIYPIIYLCMPGEIYFAQHSIARDVSAGEAGLLKVLGDNYLNRQREYVGSVEADHWSVWTRGARFSSLDATADGTVRIGFDFTALLLLRSQHVAIPIHEVLVIDYLSDIEGIPPNAPFANIPLFQLVHFEKPQPEWVQRAVWDSLLRSAKQFDGNESAFNFTPVFEHRLRALVLAARGDPSDVRGSYARMLYLSATTITTVGFGDVVPITTRARLAVATEAVCGIVLIGMFVNGIMRSTSRARGG